MSLPSLPHHARRTRPTHRDARDGRVLIECLLALTLLAVAATTLSAGTRALATLADDALLVARAHSAIHSAAERALAVACAQSAGEMSTLNAGPRVVAQQRTSWQSTALTRIVSAQLAPTPYARRDTQALALSVARPCN
jgi:hypothetical protein